MVLHGKLAVHGCLAVHGRSFGRSPQKSVAVHPKSPWPFTPKVRGRSPQKFVAVHLISPIGRSLKMGVLFRIGRSFSPFSLKVKELLSNLHAIKNSTGPQSDSYVYQKEWFYSSR